MRPPGGRAAISPKTTSPSAFRYHSMWVNPSRNPSEVMGVAEHRGNLGAERPHRDLGDGDAAIGTPEPLQVGEAGALAEAGATVIGIGESPAETLDDQLKGWLHHYEQVPSVTDVESMTRAVRQVQDKVWVDRIEATVEAHTLATAQVREACTIPGTSVRTAWLCRDKPSMKQALREAGVPTAASAAVSSAASARAFAERAGYPLILKPRSGAGA